MAAVSSPPQASGAASQISSLICASDVDVQELGLKNAAELATAGTTLFCYFPPPILAHFLHCVA